MSTVNATLQILITARNEASATLDALRSKFRQVTESISSVRADALLALAQAAQEAARAAYDLAKATADSAASMVDGAKAALDAAKAQEDAAKAYQASSTAALESAKGIEANAQAMVGVAKANKDSAQAAYDLAKANEESAKEALSAATSYEDIQKAVEDVASASQEAAKAQQVLGAAIYDLSIAEKNLENASQDVAVAQESITQALEDAAKAAQDIAVAQNDLATAEADAATAAEAAALAQRELAEADQAVSIAATQAAIAHQEEAKAAADLAAGASNAAGGVDNLGNSLKNAGGGAKSFLDSITELVGGVRGLVSGLASLAGISFFAKATEYASRSDVLATTLRVVGQNAGYTENQMIKMDKSVQSLGITAQSSRESLIQMIQAGLSIEKFAAPLARVAQDLAVVSGLNSSETFSRLVTNIQQMDTMGLRFMGITLDRTIAEKEYARTIGKTVDALTIKEQREAFANATLKEAAKLSGAYTEAMGDVGKKITSLTRYYQELLDVVGAPFQSTFNAAVDVLTVFLQNAKELAAAFGTVLAPAIKSLEAPIRAFGTALTSLMQFMTQNAGVITVFLAALSASSLVGFISAVAAGGQAVAGFGFVLSRVAALIGPLVAGFVSLGATIGRVGVLMAAPATALSALSAGFSSFLGVFEAFGVGIAAGSRAAIAAIGALGVAVFKLWAAFEVGQMIGSWLNQFASVRSVALAFVATIVEVVGGIGDAFQAAGLYAERLYYLIRRAFSVGDATAEWQAKIDEVDKKLTELDNSHAQRNARLKDVYKEASDALGVSVNLESKLGALTSEKMANNQKINEIEGQMVAAKSRGNVAEFERLKTQKDQLKHRNDELEVMKQQAIQLSNLTAKEQFQKVVNSEIAAAKARQLEELKTLIQDAQTAFDNVFGKSNFDASGRLIEESVGKIGTSLNTMYQLTLKAQEGFKGFDNSSGALLTVKEYTNQLTNGILKLMDSIKSADEAGAVLDKLRPMLQNLGVTATEVAKTIEWKQQTLTLQELGKILGDYLNRLKETVAAQRDLTSMQITNNSVLEKENAVYATLIGTKQTVIDIERSYASEKERLERANTTIAVNAAVEEANKKLAVLKDRIASENLSETEARNRSIGIYKEMNASILEAYKSRYSQLASEAQAHFEKARSFAEQEKALTKELAAFDFTTRQGVADIASAGLDKVGKIQAATQNLKTLANEANEALKGGDLERAKSLFGELASASKSLAVSSKDSATSIREQIKTLYETVQKGGSEGAKAGIEIQKLEKELQALDNAGRAGTEDYIQARTELKNIMTQERDLAKANKEAELRAAKELTAEMKNLAEVITKLQNLKITVDLDIGQAKVQEAMSKAVQEVKDFKQLAETPVEIKAVADLKMDNVKEGMLLLEKIRQDVGASSIDVMMKIVDNLPKEARDRILAAQALMKAEPLQADIKLSPEATSESGGFFASIKDAFSSLGAKIKGWFSDTPITAEVKVDTKAVDASLDKYKTPVDTKLVFAPDTFQADTEKRRLEQQSQSLHFVKPEVSEAAAAISQLQQHTYSYHTVIVNTQGGYRNGGLIGSLVRSFAGGGDTTLPRLSPGLIYGKGTGTSDSIPFVTSSGETIRTSNGEYVVKEDSVAEYGLAFMEAINNKRLRLVDSLRNFAAGGLVGASGPRVGKTAGDVSLESSSSARDEVNINFSVHNKVYPLRGPREIASQLSSALRELSRAG